MVQLRERPAAVQSRTKVTPPSPVHSPQPHSPQPQSIQPRCTKCGSRLVTHYGEIQCSQCCKEYSRADIVRMVAQQGGK